VSIQRLRCTMRFSTASGMAPWAEAQMAVRHGMARDIERTGEPKRNEVLASRDTQVLECDLPLLDAAHARDAYDTLLAVRAWVVPATGDEAPSFVEHHICHHDEDPPGPCVVVRREVLG